MLTMVKVQVQERLALLSSLVDLDAKADPSYFERVLIWVDETEKPLGRLRRPEAATLAALRGKLIAARDGFRDPEVPGDLAPRKALRAATTVYLGQAEVRLRDLLQQLDSYLQPLRAQLIQLVSAGHILGAIEPRGTSTHEQWLSRVWSQLGTNDKLRGAHVYLSTALPLIDRLYLLDEALTNLGSQPGVADVERNEDHGNE